MATPTANGAMVQISGIWVLYDPPDGLHDPDSFDYTISDGRGGTDTATVQVNIKPRIPGRDSNDHGIELAPGGDC